MPIDPEYEGLFADGDRVEFTEAEEEAYGRDAFDELVEAQHGRYGVPKKGGPAYAAALNDANAGNSVTIDSTLNGQELSLCRMVVPQERARPWTVTWSPLVVQDVVLGGVPVGRTSRSVVRIVWGAGGVQHCVEVDVAQGRSMSVFGAFVQATVLVDVQDVGKVDVIYGSIAPAFGPPTSQVLSRTVYFTDPNDFLAPGETVFRPVPPRAARWYAQEFSLNVDTRVAFQGTLGEGPRWRYLGSAKHQNDALWVPGDAQTVSYANIEPGGGGNVVDPRIVFDVVL